MVEIHITTTPGGLNAERARYALGELLRLGGVAAVWGSRLGYGELADVTISPSLESEPRLIELNRVGEPPGNLPWPRRLYALFDSADTPAGRPLYVDDGGRPRVTLAEGGVRCAVDPVATTWYLLGQIEELTRPERRDAHGRLSRALSRTPSVFFDGPRLEDWGSFIAAALAVGGVVARVGRHPDGAAWSVALTHDIDSLGERSLGRALRLIGAGALRFSGERLRAGRRMLGLLRRPDRHHRLEHCIDADAPDAGGYYVHPGRRGPHDPAYRLSRNRKVLEKLLATGQEVGHHYGYLTAGNPELLRGEAEELRRLTGLDCFGGRAHYLRLRCPADLAALEAADLEYDASLGFADAPGWRLSTGGPYRPWNHAAERPLGLFELPLPVMDGALFRPWGDATVEVEAAWRSLLPHLEAARDSGACLSLLWHQRVFGPAHPGWGEVYARALAWARENGARTVAPRELVDLARSAEGLTVHGERLIHKGDRPLSVIFSTAPDRHLPLEPGRYLEAPRA
ncbi:MAG: hypothetical protein GF403_04465 [Candidatus Coatesbacteria bacterium]|nr:hypothetical protein [Candidatus Coatesbacteria bacterium]